MGTRDEAARAIAKKADRLLASAGSGRGSAAEKKRSAGALHRIARALEGGAEEVRALAAGAADAAAEVTTADFEQAASEVFSLANRRKAKGSRSEAAGRDWEPSGDDFGLPVHRATLREAVELYDIAFSLHGEEYFAYLKALVHEQLSEFEEAVRVFEGLTGTYGKDRAVHVARCRRKHARRGSRSVPESAGSSGGDADRADSGDASDVAATTAQSFAECLADGRFRDAHVMLAAKLKARITPEDLRSRYASMTGAEPDETAADVDICVMNSETDMPELKRADLGWVYVAISGAEFNEAVTVVVTREGEEARIRELEWGRP